MKTPLDCYLKPLTHDPGVYQMIGAHQEVLYVGKARDLKKRVSSYFRKNVDDPKTRLLVSQIKRIEVIITQNETESLFLENSLIKKYLPRFNVLLRDDKSYPYIHLSAHEFPRLEFHRGPKTEAGEYFGPYPSAHGVRENLQTLQKIFKLRQCNDHYFANRSRPCLWYQIKRCSGPCVGLISKEDYAQDVERVRLFLQGKSQVVLMDLAHQMDQTAKSLNFELAAKLRDQLVSLRKLQEQQDVVNTDEKNADFIAIARLHEIVGVQVLMVREGRLFGHKTFFPKVPSNTSPQEVLGAFLPQFYLTAMARIIPPKIFINLDIPDRGATMDALSQQANKMVAIIHAPRGERARLLNIAEKNATQAVAAHLSTKLTLLRRFENLQTSLGLGADLKRIECIDVSHTRGEATVASCVVFNQEGPLKKDYRHYNIKDITPGDDYAAMRQTLLRRFKRGEQGVLPDVLLVDGGKGQFKQAQDVLSSLNINQVLIIGVAKGRERKPGLETLWLSMNKKLDLDASALAFHLIQQVRDEAHRFAITGHRARRHKLRTTSPLEKIAGIGPKRRRELLRHFGGWQEIKSASLDDIAKVPGISRALAEKILKGVRES